MLFLMVLITSVVEGVAFLIMQDGEHNLWLYNLYLGFQLPLALLVIRSLTHSDRLCLWIKAIFLAHFAIWVWEMHDKGIQDQILGISAVMSSMFIAALFTSYLVLLSNSILRPVHRTAEFWVALAFVAFHGVTLPLNGLIDYLTGLDVELASRMYEINDLLFFMHYGALIVVFGWALPAQALVGVHD